MMNTTSPLSVTKILELVQSFVESRASDYDAIAKDIWEHPELSYEEARSSALYRDRLVSQGFKVRELPEMNHSFIAEKQVGPREPEMAPGAAKQSGTGSGKTPSTPPGTAQASAHRREARHCVGCNTRRGVLAFCGSEHFDGV